MQGVLNNYRNLVAKSFQKSSPEMILKAIPCWILPKHELFPHSDDSGFSVLRCEHLPTQRIGTSSAKLRRGHASSERKLANFQRCSPNGSAAVPRENGFTWATAFGLVWITFTTLPALAGKILR